MLAKSSLFRIGAASLMLLLAACRADPDGVGGVASGPATTEAHPSGGVPAAVPGEGWNPTEIEWQGYEAGLAKAKAENKPILLVISATWCPHCKSYSHVFEDARVTKRAKDFVMVRVDADQRMDVSTTFKPDGMYVPRTYFLGPDGTPDYDVRAPRPKFAYFFDEKNPASILGAMDEAARRFKK